MPPLRHVALLLRADRSLDRGVALGVGDYLHENPHWSLYVDKGDLLWEDFQTWHADGVIAGADQLRELPAEVIERLDAPLIEFGGPEPGAAPGTRPQVMSDHQAIGAMAAEYLINQGMRRFAYCGSETPPDFAWSVLRCEGFKQKLAEAGYEATVYEPPEGPKRDWEHRQQRVADWLASLEKPIGVMAFFDERARELLEACRISGVSVPDDVSIVGVDNDEWMCNLPKPTITSVDTGLKKIGYEAAVLLNQLMDGSDAESPTVLIGPERVVARGSTDVSGFANAEVAAAVQFIRTHACDPITVTDVLNHAGLSTSKAHRDFHAALGRSVHQEIQRVQMEQIKHLLIHTNHSIKQIAYAAGFENSKYMSKLFRKLVGVTPTAYRRTQSTLRP